VRGHTVTPENEKTSTSLNIASQTYNHALLWDYC